MGQRVDVIRLARWKVMIWGMLLAVGGIEVKAEIGDYGPRTKGFGEWVKAHGGAGVLDEQEVAKGVELATKRARELREVMERDPAAFVRGAMAESERAQLPTAVQALVEKRVKGRGFFGTYCILPSQEAVEAGAGDGHRSGFGYEVRIDGVAYQGFAYGRWRDAGTVYDAQIEGVALDGAIAVGDSPTPGEQVASGQTVSAYSPSTTGPNTLLYMIAQFSDQTTDPIDEATVFSQMGVVSNYWMNCSGGSVYIKGLVHTTQAVDIVHIKLPSTASAYVNNFGLLLNDARAAASAQGYNYASYNLDVVVTSNSGFGYAGLSYVGAQGSHWVAGYTSLRTAGHELGHNLGLWHANYWRTDSTQPFGKDSNPGGYVGDYLNGEWVEYGHYFDLMSAQFGGEWDDATKPIYSPAEKVKLGWLSGSQVQYVTASGTYRLFRHDARATVGTPRGIRIETPATDYTGYGRRYWLQYRYAPWNTAQNWSQNGVEVDVCSTSYGSDGTIQLDMTPYSYDQSSPFFDPNNKPGGWWTIDNSDKLDGALILGRTYDDASAGIHITPLSRGSNGTGEEYVDVVINLGAFPGDNPPNISAFTVSTNHVAVGQAVSFGVAAADPDGDALAYSWDFGQAQVWTQSGLNTNTAAKSWPVAGQYRVMVRVSDMKGGVATASTVITVGAPASTGQIWGRVVWSGQPVAGARIWTNSWAGAGAAQAWTDSDGSYVLAGLPSGSYTLNCQAAGLTFTPQFANPVSLVSGNVYGEDFYANEALAGGGGTLYTVSGQVTDPVSGAAGVEVRAGGMVTTTDASGNYQFTNFVNGTYTITARKDGWTFSPGTRSVTINSANSTGNNFSRVASYSISGNFSGVPAGAQDPAPTVYLSNGRSVAATKGGSGGNKYWTYTVNNVPAGSYSVSAYLYGYSNAPSGFSNPLSIASSISGINFAGTAATLAGAISGRVTQYGVPLAGAAVQVAQGGSSVATVFSDSDGYYRADNLPAGAYTVVPSKTGYSFSPGSISVASVPSSGRNFSAVGSATPPSISGVSANPAVVPSAAATTTLSVMATGTGPLTYSWDAVAAAAPVSYSVNDSIGATTTTVAFAAPGSYVFRARVTNTNGLSTTATVSATVSAGAGTMVVAPYEAQVPAGQTAAFHADAWDQLGNRIAVSPSWSVNGGGSIETNGVLSAMNPGGPYQVVAVAAGLSATSLVWVTSGTVNHPPVLAAINDRTIHAGSTLVITNRATDVDPGQTLVFSLDPGFPAGATIGAANGLFSWSTTAAQAGTTNGVTVRVTDNGTPVLSDAKSFVVRVAAALRIRSVTATNGSISITWDAIPGTVYRVQSTTNAGSGVWETLVPEVVAGGVTASWTEAMGTGARFYRVGLGQ